MTLGNLFDCLTSVIHHHLPRISLCVCVWVCLFSVSEQELVQDLCVSSVWPVMEKHDAVLHWNPTHTHRWDQFAQEFTSLIFKGNFVDLFSGRFKMGRKPSQIVLNGRKSFKSMETSLFFFSPQKMVELISPYTKITARTLLVRSKNRGFFFLRHCCRRPARWGPAKIPFKLPKFGGGFGYNPRLTHL